MPLTRRFDPLFRQHGRSAGIPVAYFRALAKRESNFNPRDTQGPAWGLMQVTEVTRRAFNQRRGRSVSRAELLDPDTNVEIAADELGKIIDNYKRFHDDPNLQPDWQNPEFIKLLTAGWNAGYSERAGVGRVAGYLEKRGLPVTHDRVFAHAGRAGAIRFLQMPKRKAWQRTVAELYFQQPDVPTMGRLVAKLAVAGIAGVAAYALLMRIS